MPFDLQRIVLPEASSERPALALQHAFRICRQEQVSGAGLDLEIGNEDVLEVRPRSILSDLSPSRQQS